MPQLKGGKSYGQRDERGRQNARPDQPSYGDPDLPRSILVRLVWIRLLSIQVAGDDSREQKVDACNNSDIHIPAEPRKLELPDIEDEQNEPDVREDRQAQDCGRNEIKQAAPTQFCFSSRTRVSFSHQIQIREPRGAGDDQGGILEEKVNRENRIAVPIGASFSCGRECVFFCRCFSFFLSVVF